MPSLAKFDDNIHSLKYQSQYLLSQKIDRKIFIR